MASKRPFRLYDLETGETIVACKTQTIVKFSTHGGREWKEFKIKIDNEEVVVKREASEKSRAIFSFNGVQRFTKKIFYSEEVKSFKRIR